MNRHSSIGLQGISASDLRLRFLDRWAGKGGLLTPAAGFILDMDLVLINLL